MVLIIFPLNYANLPISTADSSGGERTYVYTSSVVYINLGDSDMVLDEGYRFFNLFMNTSWQTVYLLKASHSFVTDRDSDGNPIIILTAPSISRGGNLSMSISLRIVAKQRSPPTLSFSASGSLSDIPDGLQDYIGRAGSWLTDNQTLRDLAYGLKKDKTRVLEVVTALADWIGINIKPNSSDVPRYPTETYDSRKGDCDDQSNLLITLCRILGIPAYLQVGLLEKSTQEKETFWSGHVIYSTKYVGYHGWAMVYVPPWGWLPFDMTLGWKSSDSLSVVKSALIWSSASAQMMNITKMDWAGEGEMEKENVTRGQLYMQYEDTLINEGHQSWLEILSQNWETLTIIVITVIVAGYWIRRYRIRNRTIMSKVGRNVRNLVDSGSPDPFS